MPWAEINTIEKEGLGGRRSGRAAHRSCVGDTRAMRLHRSQLKRECGAGAGGGPDPPGAGPAARIGGRLAGLSGSRGRGSASGEEARPGAGDAAAAAETGSGGGCARVFGNESRLCVQRGTESPSSSLLHAAP